MNGVPVMVHIPGDLFGKLEQIAVRNQVSVADLLVEVGRRAVAARSKRTHRLTDAQLALIVHHTERGKSQEAIARMMGVSRAAVNYQLRMLRLRPTDRPRS